MPFHVQRSRCFEASVLAALFRLVGTVCGCLKSLLDGVFVLFTDSYTLCVDDVVNEF